jgi:hypothetical protein
MVKTEQTTEYMKVKVAFNNDFIGSVLHLTAVCHSNNAELDVKVTSLI